MSSFDIFDSMTWGETEYTPTYSLRIEAHRAQNIDEALTVAINAMFDASNCSPIYSSESASASYKIIRDAICALREANEADFARWLDGNHDNPAYFREVGE